MYGKNLALAGPPVPVLAATGAPGVNLAWTVLAILTMIALGAALWQLTPRARFAKK